jgi:hypothetical protein
MYPRQKEGKHTPNPKRKKKKLEKKSLWNRNIIAKYYFKDDDINILQEVRTQGNS